MNGILSFEVDSGHFTRQIDPVRDRAALDTLARRCVDYLRLAIDKLFPNDGAPAILRRLLLPSRVPVEQSYVLGIYASPAREGTGAAYLEGVLYFLRPPGGADTRYITLLLLEPDARGRGLGTAINQAFKCWAAARGAGRLLVAVSDKNPRGEHFWRDRMGYQETESIAWKQTGAMRKHREFEYSLRHLRTSPWRG